MGRARRKMAEAKYGRSGEVYNQLICNGMSMDVLMPQQRLPASEPGLREYK
jgi:hypothetical protein